MQRELDEFRLTVWNTHRIRAQKETLMADGIPDHIFTFPERYGMEKKGCYSICYSTYIDVYTKTIIRPAVGYFFALHCSKCNDLLIIHV